MGTLWNTEWGFRKWITEDELLLCLRLQTFQKQMQNFSCLFLISVCVWTYACSFFPPASFLCYSLEKKKRWRRKSVISSFWTVKAFEMYWKCINHGPMNIYLWKDQTIVTKLHWQPLAIFGVLQFISPTFIARHVTLSGLTRPPCLKLPRLLEHTFKVGL